MKSLLFFSGLALGVLYIIGCQPKSPDDVSSQETAMTKEDSVKRGEYLALTMGCNDCHTPKIMTDKGPAPDPSRKLSGHPAGEPLPPLPGPTPWILFHPGLTAAVGPWGTSFAANLTPDETGTGNWTLENFDKALRQGKFKGLEGTRMLLPPMPWQHYTHLTDEDLSNLWAYLQSIPPVKNVVPDAIPPQG